MGVKLLSEHHLEFLSLNGGCTGWSESTLVKMPHFWKSHVKAHIEVEGAQGPGRFKMEWKKLAQKDFHEWELVTVNPKKGSIDIRCDICNVCS